MSVAQLPRRSSAADASAASAHRVGSAACIRSASSPAARTARAGAHGRGERSGRRLLLQSLSQLRVVHAEARACGGPCMRRP
eukprot:4515123-Prymnesium_polylepis.1